MTALIGALIFCAIVVLICVVVIWAIETILAMLGGPPNVGPIVRVIVILIGLLLIIQRLWPLANSYV